MFLISDDPNHAARIFQRLFGDVEGADRLVTISDQELARLPFLDDMLTSIKIASTAIASGLETRPDQVSVVIAVLYGDGAASRMRVVVENDQTTVLIIVDLRIVIECVAHVGVSPLGRYTPSVDVSAAIEKLAVATRIALMRDHAFAHLAMGILAEAQDVIHGTLPHESAISLTQLIESSFLSADQVSMVLRAALLFLVFHEFGHFVCKQDPLRRGALERNLSNYARVQTEKAADQLTHDQENSKLVRQIFGEAEFDLVLTRETSAIERGRLLEARLLARQDKEELLCDNFAVQNLAKILVDRSGLGSSDWLLVRYTIEYLLVSSWSVYASRPIFIEACCSWNRTARGEEPEHPSGAADRLAVLISERRSTVLVQRFRLRYALEQFDAIMAVLLHGAIKSELQIEATIDRMSPSSAMARVLHEFSARHGNLIDRSLYTIEGLARCSGRGRAMSTLLSPGDGLPAGAVGDVFSFYVLGQGYHLV